ncbi:1-deoxy-D-xylulose-5-phosphate reductoisomerase [Dokdonella fugitiva]|jgi:1-deoxy-D-xylulose-5-phosphate reductoisomerase|uniref:1-deoxy-D-xylulose 5-phosphate reductoisomerase n=1 Tax=Dokdonella fugitiva TaxID=328517 RepID=A0A4R2I5C9_9GAMM|nr:1-deoxy-D-xylulose-5-phosphate reductoisomerase [Dokdonella fugitiva]MBA8884063.1 1-deoxy-D-xylulose-5-phosphate reductoisomerase [Dokdonella fugitiva]TCO38759.1 1-deoxy-D-xylulose 5-phosphate reductoisomerase [Dokdonella fugitiva]
MKTLAVLGATGSIGASTLDVVARHPDRYRIGVLAAHRSVDALADLCARFRPELAVIADPACERDLRERLRERGLACRVGAGADALVDAAAGAHCDTVVAAIVGAAGLESTLAAARAGKRLLLANKEAVVMAGALLAAALDDGGGTLLPLDSEHNAVFQCLPRGHADLDSAGVKRILLTASGGPFRGRTAADLASITPEQACAHPNWRMGRKISVDSATLMNKGLEVIEAHHLFRAPAERIEVVVHPQSIVHSLVEYADGSLLAQLGNPDMRTAIAYALAWPGRIDAGVGPLDLVRLGRLDFEAPDLATFRCLALAYRALAAGGAATIVLNAANEEAVAAFLDGRLPFLAIAETIERCLAEAPAAAPADLTAILDADLTARRHAQRMIAALSA